MKLIVCVDNDMGMMFHNRRQSKDSMLRKKIISVTNGSRLWMNAYSFRQFEELDFHSISVDEDFWKKAGTEDYIFLENVPAANVQEQIDEIIIFYWNRKYPSDFSFDLNLNHGDWKLVHTEDFAGHSHEKITMETYRRMK